MCAYLDDIIITGKKEEHSQNLSAVLSKLQEAGLRLKKSKCYFMAESVEYLGHIIGPAPYQGQSGSCAKCTNPMRHHPVKILN